MAKEIDLKALTTATETLQNVAGSGTLGTVNSIMGNINELLKSGLTLWNTMRGQQTGQFPALNQQSPGVQTQLPLKQPAPAQPGLAPVSPNLPSANPLNAESVFKSIADVLELLSKAKPNMTVAELVKELQTNKAMVIDGIQKGMGGGNVKPKS